MYSGDHAWYTFGRLWVVCIWAIMPGTHSGGYAWYILARSMTGNPVHYMSNKEYLKSVGEKGGENESIIHLLGDGWEPYTLYGENKYFRRKYKD
jgi:hypothetical protein